MTSRKIVLIEDDAAFRAALAAALQHAGFAVRMVSDHTAFLRSAAEGNAVDADLFLVDVKLPGILGDAVTKIFLKSGRAATIPVLLLSGLGEEELKSRAKTSGADGYICKSWGMNEIVARVRSLLAGQPVASDAHED